VRTLSKSPLPPFTKGGCKKQVLKSLFNKGGFRGIFSAFVFATQALFQGLFLCSLVLIALLHFPSGIIAEDGKIPVAASILPLADFCEKIGGDRVAVQVLIPPGASPHVFEPTPKAVAKALTAKVFVYVGAGLDPWATRLLKTQAMPNQVVVEAVHGMKLMEDVEPWPLEKAPPDRRSQAHRGEGEDKGQAHHHEGGNPHVWLDPVLAQDICRRLAQALIQADPTHKKDYEENLARYLGQLVELHQEIAQKVGTFSLRDYVCFHPAFTYFARRYGLREVGVIEAAPGREPSPGHLHQIIVAIKKSGGRAVFAEPQFSPRVAEVIAREAGVKVLFLDPLGGRPPYDTDYLKLMRYNLAVLTEALK